MAQEHPITRLGGWAGYEVVEDWQERRGGKSWCVLRLEAVTGWLRQCSHCGESTRAVHDQQERRIRELPIFEYRVELVVPRVRVACARCGPRLERLSWLEPYARLTRRLAWTNSPSRRAKPTRPTSSSPCPRSTRQIPPPIDSQTPPGRIGLELLIDHASAVTARRAAASLSR